MARITFPTLLLAALLCRPALAQTPAQGAEAPARPGTGNLNDEAPRGEPQVKRTVNEDEGAKIEELKVRGNTTRISVTPKVGTTRRYEMITEDGSRDISDGLTGSRGAAGKRVWRVLDF
jgi:hypothetical protein